VATRVAPKEAAESEAAARAAAVTEAATRAASKEAAETEVAAKAAAVARAESAPVDWERTTLRPK